MHSTPRTVIAHTRFATSSANIVTELHPHEWTPFKEEIVWRFNSIIGKFERSSSSVGVHITHNGDFDEMEAYLQVTVLVLFAQVNSFQQLPLFESRTRLKNP